MTYHDKVDVQQLGVPAFFVLSQDHRAIAEMFVPHHEINETVHQHQRDYVILSNQYLLRIVIQRQHIMVFEYLYNIRI